MPSPRFTIYPRKAPVPPRGAARLFSLVVIAVGIGAILSTISAGATPAPIGLGTADSFAVLAGAGITNTGPTTITGDIGTFPTPAETGFGSVTLSGTNHDGDAVTQRAKDDLTTAYNVAAGTGPASAVPTELGGGTLKAGVYHGATLGITGTLTLDAEGIPGAVFVFQAESTLITATGSRVVLINGAQACNVFWQIGSSATLATSSSFVGTILALTSITANTGATIDGRLLARNGAVTLDNNTISRPGCAEVTTTTSVPITTITVPSTTTSVAGTTTTLPLPTTTLPSPTTTLPLPTTTLPLPTTTLPTTTLPTTTTTTTLPLPTTTTLLFPTTTLLRLFPTTTTLSLPTTTSLRPLPTTTTTTTTTTVAATTTTLPATTTTVPVTTTLITTPGFSGKGGATTESGAATLGALPLTGADVRIPIIGGLAIALGGLLMLLLARDGND